MFVIHAIAFSHLEDEERDWVIKIRETAVKMEGS
jgi:hypothetical protein